MIITLINGEPYSKLRAAEIEDSKREELARKRIISSNSPYSYSSTKDIVTVQFTANDEEKGISLPFTTNVNSVHNVTQYRDVTRMAPLKRIRFGALQSIEPMKLDAFLDMVSKNENYSDVSLFQRTHVFQGVDLNRPNDGPMQNYAGPLKKTVPVHPTIADTVNEIRDAFITYPRYFVIDPQSDIRVETRENKKGKTYEGSLKVIMYTGLSGLPGMEETFVQTIRARDIK